MSDNASNAPELWARDIVRGMPRYSQHPESIPHVAEWVRKVMQAAHAAGRREGVGEAKGAMHAALDKMPMVYTSCDEPDLGRMRAWLRKRIEKEIRALLAPAPAGDGVAGDCCLCGGPIMHAPGRPGEFDHECTGGEVDGGGVGAATKDREDGSVNRQHGESARGSASSTPPPGRCDGCGGTRTQPGTKTVFSGFGLVEQECDDDFHYTTTPGREE